MFNSTLFTSLYIHIFHVNVILYSTFLFWAACYSHQGTSEHTNSFFSYSLYISSPWTFARKRVLATRILSRDIAVLSARKIGPVTSSWDLRARSTIYNVTRDRQKTKKGKCLGATVLRLPLSGFLRERFSRCIKVSHWMNVEFLRQEWVSHIKRAYYRVRRNLSTELLAYK